MSDRGSNSSALYAYLLANSLFTPRQLSIISKQLQGGGKPETISSGAYYRQVKQCRKKVISILYSMMLLQSMGIVQSEALATLSKLAEQLAVIFASESSSDAMSRLNVEDVISVINEVIKRVSKL
jgi:nanoRNase/pAp phosphatase (c-di-AMP/oligoRNAs hydrolase)